MVAEAFPWLLRQKIAVPDRVTGYVHRTELVARAMPTHRRLTVLKASGGFGKTTLLAECCRSLRTNGVHTAWVSLDARDEPAVLDSYVAFACLSTGLEVLDVTDPEGDGVGTESRTPIVLREIQRFGKPFVIALDGLERLENPASVALLDFLLQRGPPNLHIMVAGRQIPDGLNVAGAVLEGQAEILEADDLRFSRADVARFFDLSLSRGELAEEMDRSAGWPLALQISRNRMNRGPEVGEGVVQDFVRNWMESSLLADLGRDNRDFLLDLSLFDWIDAELLDEVLQRNDSRHRLGSMGVLAGLLQPLNSGATAISRLHPLVQEHCARQRFVENPERFRAIHRRIAEALVRRGETVSAMRHAMEGGERLLAGEILEQAGGVRLWTREGVLQLQAADRLLTEDVIGLRPRLALVRCVTLVLSGNLREARRLYGEVSAGWPAARKEDDTDFDTSVDDCIARGCMALYGGESVGSDRMRSLADDMAELARSQRLDPLTCGHMEYARCVLHHLKGEFDSALERLAVARELLGESRYIALYGDLLSGQILMAQGQVQPAESRFHRARRIAGKSFVLDPVPAVGCELVMKELALECNRVSPVKRLPSLPRALKKYGVPFSLFATGASLVIELRLRAGLVEQALSMVDEMLAYLRATGLTSLVRYLAALRVSVLVIAGRIDDAQRAWRRDRLPERSDGCVDLAGQTWREMEAVSCARLRWLTAVERFEEARGLARALRAITVERSLRRTQMRALALSMVLERRAGEPEAAVGYLKAFFDLYTETPYAWPVVQERANCAQVVRTFLEIIPDSPYRNTARSLLAAMRRLEAGPEPVLSQREREVLRRLDEGQRDKQIAAELGITVHGVRFHLRKLFTKLDVHKRSEAVRRARELDVMPIDPR